MDTPEIIFNAEIKSSDIQLLNKHIFPELKAAEIFSEIWERSTLGIDTPTKINICMGLKEQHTLSFTLESKGARILEGNNNAQRTSLPI